MKTLRIQTDELMQKVIVNDNATPLDRLNAARMENTNAELQNALDLGIIYEMMFLIQRNQRRTMEFTLYPDGSGEYGFPGESKIAFSRLEIARVNIATICK